MPEGRAKKLFELLVVEGQLKAQAQATRADLRNTFEKKRHLFEEKRKTFLASDEGAAPVVEEQSDIQSTVPSELKWIADIWTKAIDTSYQVAEGNTQARGDVVLDNGTVLLSAVPATALLELEKRAGEIQDLLMAVPTLDPAKGFKPDPDRGKNIFRARDVSKARTKKIEDFVVVVPATEQHPAQVAKVNKDITTGTIAEQEWSALITPARKGELIERVEQLRGLNLAYLHVALFGASVDYHALLRPLFNGRYLIGGGLDRNAAETLIAEGRADAVVFGSAFLANPDLPERFRTGAELNVPDKNTFYAPGAQGYIDYPAMSPAQGA